MPKLYGHARRTAANILKIRAALSEAGADYEYVVVDLAHGEQKTPEYLALNPHGKVPVLVDDDFVLPESDAILWYLAERYPNARLLPADARGRARVLEWCDFASSGLYVWSYEHFTHTSQAEPANRSAWVAGRARAALDRALDVLEKRLTGREFVASESLSIADFAVSAVVLMLETRSQLELAAYPHIGAHYRRITARPAWIQAAGDSP
jgi:glutathione S-transferase